MKEDYLEFRKEPPIEKCEECSYEIDLCECEEVLE